MNDYYIEFHNICIAIGFTGKETRRMYKEITEREAIKPSIILLYGVIIILLFIPMLYAAFNDELILFILTLIIMIVIRISHILTMRKFNFKNEYEYILALKYINDQKPKKKKGANG